MNAVEPDTAKNFEKQGYCVAPNFVREGELSALLSASDSISADQVHLTPADLNQRTLMEPPHSEEWRSRVESVVSTTITSTLGVQFFRRGSPTGIPPHRDADYFPGKRVLCLWVALEEVDAHNGGVMLKASNRFQTFPLEPGSALLFDGELLHKSPRPKTLTRSRLSLVTHYEIAVK